MKLLFDQNISFRIIKLLKEDFFDCIHVSRAGLTNATDLEIWNFAKSNGYTIVTYDADFLNLVTYQGFPPKVIRIGTANRKTIHLANFIQNNTALIESFINGIEYHDVGYLELSE